MIDDTSIYKTYFVKFVPFSVTHFENVTVNHLLDFDVVEEELEQDRAKVKQIVLSKLGKVTRASKGSNRKL